MGVVSVNAASSKLRLKQKVGNSRTDKVQTSGLRLYAFCCLCVCYQCLLDLRKDKLVLGGLDKTKLDFLF